MLRDSNVTVSPTAPDVCGSDGRNLQLLESNRHCQVLCRIPNEVACPQAFLEVHNPAPLLLAIVIDREGIRMGTSCLRSILRIRYLNTKIFPPSSPRHNLHSVKSTHLD